MNKIKYILLALTALFAVSCLQDKVFEEITSVPLKRCLEPMNLSAKVDANSGVLTTFRWDVTTDAEEYLLEVLDAKTSEAVLTKTLVGKEVPFVTDELEADRTYTFRVTAKSSKLQDSKVAEYDGSFKTYAVKDNLFLVVAAKSAESVSLTWSKDASDYRDVTHIEATPVAGGAAVSKELNATEAEAAAAVIGGLAPSAEYDIVLFFKSASRGAVTVWTAPAQGSLSRVTTSEALIAAMTAGDDVYVGAEGSPYVVGSVTPAKGFRMLGEYAADGSRPVVQGDIVLNVGYTGDLHIENIHFDGTARSRIIDHKGGELNIEKISLVNCEITGYNCGIFYDNVADQLTLGELLIEGCDIYNIPGSGGDGVDVRNAAAIGTITFRNNTVYDAFRSFFRIDDKSTSLNAFVMENNTIKNVAIPDKGILYIRCPWTSLSAKNNLFLYQQGEKAVLATTNLPENAPANVSGSNNYCYAIGEKFFGESKNFTAAQIGATVLADDPCFNAKGNNFHLSNADLQDKQVGAAKWWNAYVEPVEDLTLAVTAAPHVWNLGDATLFAGDLEKSKVRDGLLFVASEERKMNLDGAISFNAAAAVNKKGVPTDGYVAFKAAENGSVVIKMEDPDADGCQIVVAVGDADGGAATVKGGAVANANGDPQKVVLTGISEESLVYLYPTGASKITALAWSADVAGVNTALAAPKLAIDVESITEGDETPISVSWGAVANAANYTVTFNKKKTTTEELSFVIDAETAAALAAGVYTVSVVANPDAADTYNTASEAATVAFAVMAPAGGGEVTVEKTLTWDFSSEDWQAELASKGAKGADITNWESSVDGLTWTSTQKSKWNTATINEETVYYIQAGGKSDGSDRFFRFTAPAAGQLRVTASNTGSSEDLTRMVTVSVNGGEPQSVAGGAPSTAPTVCEFEIEAGAVKIYPTGNGLRFLKIEFTYLETTSGGGQPPIAKEDYVWDFSSEAWQTELAAKGAKGADITNWVSTVDGLTWTSTQKSKWNTATINEETVYYIQAGGKSDGSDRFFSFTANSAGKLSVTASNTGSSEDLTRMVTVSVNDGEPQSIAGGVPSTAPAVCEFDIDAGAVKIYPTGNGLRFLKIEFHSK